MQNMTKGSSYSPNKVQRVEKFLQEDKGSTKTLVMVNETMEEHPYIDESTMGDRQLDEVFLPSFISEENNSSENKKEGLGFPLFSPFEEKPEFPLGSDELIEQGVVRKLDLAQDSDDYYFLRWNFIQNEELVRKFLFFWFLFYFLQINQRAMQCLIIKTSIAGNSFSWLIIHVRDIKWPLLHGFHGNAFLFFV